jgi:hypothetical protein
MSNWYTTREQFKEALGIHGSTLDTLIDKKIASAARTIDARMGRRFIPVLATRYYPWPQRKNDGKQHLWLDEDLISVDTDGLTTANGTVTIDATDFFLEPVNTGPPYRTIEIDLGDDVASDASFASDDSAQRAIAVAGQWAYGNDTETAGTLAVAIATTTATTLVCSDGSLIDVGHTLLIGTEQVWVSGRATVDTACNTNGALTAEQSETTVTVTDGTKVKAGEVILINSEKMYVQDVTGNDATLVRAYDGTTLATHDDAQDVYAYRTLTVVRGVNGTTAATHLINVAITKYAPPEPIQALNLALAIFNYEQDKGGRTGIVGTDDLGVRVNPRALQTAWDDASVYREPSYA